MRFSCVCTLALMVASAAQGQNQSNYCQFLQDRIQDMRTSATGLTTLVTAPNYTLAQCSLDPGVPYSEDQLYGCLDNPGVLGVWRDAETRMIYVVVSKDQVRNIAAQNGYGEAAVQNAFNIADGVRNKIAYGGVIEGLQAEIKAWEESYRTECGGAQGPSGPNNNCLLGVCPQPIP